MNFLVFLIRRFRHHWILLITFILGVILATAFLASGPILVDALLEYGLRRALIRANQKEDVFYLNAWDSMGLQDYLAFNERLFDFIQTQFEPLEVNLVPAGRVGFMYPWLGEQITLEQRLTLGFYGTSTQELRQHVDVLQGDLPDSAVTASSEIPVYIGSLMAQEWGLQAGDRLPVSISTRAVEPEFTLFVTGIITPKSFQDPYWLDLFTPFRNLEAAEGSQLFGVFVDREAFFELTGRFYPSLDTNYMWLGNLGLDRIQFENLPELQRILGNLPESVLTVNERLRVNSTLLTMLDNYFSQSNIARAPLYFLIGIIVLMALYYLVMMSSLYLEQVKSEFSVLRSRGSSVIQLFNIGISEGVFFGLLAVLAGPVLGWLAVRLLAAYGPLAILVEPEWGLSLPQAAWLAAGVAAFAGASSFLLPLPGMLRESITTHKQRQVRPGGPPWWQRLYLDVLALLIGMVLLYRLQLYGSFIGGTREDPQLDLMLILAPLSLLLGTAAIFLRIFPLFLKKTAEFAGRGRGLPIVLALSQAARDPRHVTRLALLLMLAMALGIFSTSLDATMARNEVDRSKYFAGSDIRLVTNPAALSDQNILGVQDNTWVWRSEASLLAGAPAPALDILAVDPENFSALASYRSDFSDQPVEQLLLEMEKDWETNQIPLPVTVLPGEPAQMGIWFGIPFSLRENPDRVDMILRTQFEIRLNAADGEIINVTLNPVYILEDPEAPEDPENPETPWSFFQGEIPLLHPESYPLRLISIWLQSNGLELADFEPLWLDDIVVIDRETGVHTIVESFEFDNVYEYQSLTQPMRLFVNQSLSHSEDAGLAMYFDRTGIAPLRWYGVSNIDDLDLQAIPALVSPKFLENTKLEVGDFVRIRVYVPGNFEWDRVTFKILGQANYFPTLYETEDAGFLVTLQKPLFEQINLYRFYPVQSNEVLLEADDTDIVSQSLLRSGYLPDDFFSAQATLSDLRSNTLVIGLRSVTLFGYILTTVLSLVGFASHFYLSTRQRASQYSILRALGLSPGQLYTTLLAEQFILVVSGLTLGTFLGIMLNQLTLPGLPLRLGDLDTIPPFIVQIDWGLIFQVYLTLVLAFFVSIGMAILLLWRIKIHRVLRIGEE